MKKIKGFVFIFFLFVCPFSNAQVQRIELTGTLTHDFAGNPSGGLRQAFGVQGNIDLIAQLNLWEKGSFQYHGLINYGDLLSSRMGDLQVANNMEAPKGYKTYALWYEHIWKKASIKIGQQEINNSFAWTENGLRFINSSFGIGPEFTVNVPLSTFPLTGLGIVWMQSLRKNVRLRLGLFDGNPGLDSRIPWTDRMVVNKEEGSFRIGELQWFQNGQHRLGAWQHRTQSGQSRLQGYYLMGDIPLVKTTDQSHPLWGLFYQLGWVAKSAPVVSNYQGLGIVRTGLFTDTKDGMGIAFARAGLSSIWQDQLGTLSQHSESVIEMTYYYQPQKFLRIQPNWQYIFNPAQKSGSTNAMVFLLRIQIGAL